MKFRPYVFIVSIFLIAFPKMISAQNYTEKWNVIDQNESEGKYKSNLNLVNEILSQAKKDKNSPQIIKALFYQSKIFQQTVEEGKQPDLDIINRFKTEINLSSGSQKYFLENILAQLYNQYYVANRYNIRQRTDTDNTPADFQEWSENQFKNTTDSLFQSSLTNKDALLNENLDNWKNILTPENADTNLKLNLYHLLAQYYIDFLSSDYAFSWTDEEQKNNPEKINDITQNLINHYQAKNQTDAYLYVKSNELLSAKSKSKITNKEYTAALQELIAQYKSDYIAQIYYLLAQQLVSDNKNKEAVELTNQAIEKYPKSKWTINNVLYKQVLLKPSINLFTKRFNAINQSIPIGIEHQNINQIYTRLYQINNTPDKYISETPIEIENVNINTYDWNGTLIESQTMEVKEFNDYLKHKTIWTQPSLPPGEYVLAYSNNKDFIVDEKNDNLIFSYNAFFVSKYVVLSSNKYKLQILDRETGEPIPQQSFRIYKFLDFRYMYYSEGTTNDKGFSQINIPEREYYEQLYILINQEFIPISRDYNYEYEVRIKKETQAEVFLDRAIYRPGQTVYFKSIIYNKLKSEVQALINTPVEVILINANYETVSTLKLTTNEFGSIFGEFILPNSGLTGNYHIGISVDNEEIDNKYFKVEEYKRPKFEVKFDELKSDYKLNEPISIKGYAQSFAGSNITDAKVKYRIIRTEIFPYPIWDGYRCFYTWRPPSKPEEIAQGETTTDENGKFTVDFKTLTPPTNTKENRVFNYTVYADITDINGETQANDISLKAGDVPILLSLETPDKMSIEEFTQVTVNSTNLNGIEKGVPVIMSISKLKSPDRILNPHDFGFVPDYDLSSKQELIKNFPHLVFDPKEKNPEYWEIDHQVFYADFNTTKSKTEKLPQLTYGGIGHYIIDAYTVYQNDTIRTQKIIELYDPKTYKTGNHEYLEVHLDKKEYKVGEKAKIYFITDAKDSKLTYFYAHDQPNKPFRSEDFVIDLNQKNSIEILITENMKNGLELKYHFIKYNDYVNGSIDIPVQNEIPKLEITTKVFRDKLQPGQPETWELTISGKDKDKVTAELLAAMYDESLDQFAVNTWNFNPRAYSFYNPFTGFDFYSFNQLRYSSSAYYKYNNYAFKNPTLSYIDYFGFNFGNGYGNYGYVNDEIQASGVRGRGILQRSEAITPSAPPPPSSPLAERALMEKSGGINTENNMMIVSDKAISEKDKSDKKPDFMGVKIRKNLQETAFFFPNLYTDTNGNIVLKFTSPEALTRWKVLLLAHTKNLTVGQKELSVQTQKELMLMPNPPRFLREGDQITFSTKIANLTDKPMTGDVKIEIVDPFSNQDITNQFIKDNLVQKFNIAQNGNTSVSWQLKIPQTHQAIIYRIIATTGKFSDGEENALPILSNRMLVTETMPLSIREGQQKTFVMDKLVNNQSNTLQNFNLSLQLTTNPLWLAVMSLPYLREYPYECSEQLFARLYGNMLSTYIINSSPKIKQVFETLNKNNLGGSKLGQNEELKNILLEETPWLQDAENETEQMQRVAVFFELNKMKSELRQAKNKLISRQKSNGGFAWFNGGDDNVYITNYLIAGFGKLKKMIGSEFNVYLENDGTSLVKKSIQYTDKKMLYEWNEYIAQRKRDEKAGLKSSDYIPYTFVQYLYARSFWLNEYALPSNMNAMKTEVLNYLKPTFDLSNNLQQQALSAVVLSRYGKKEDAKKYLTYFKETSTESDEMGMYWRQNTSGWYWWNAPVETQSVIIEAFDEITPEDVESIEAMKVWLIKNKQTNAWETTKSTCEAVYTLMNTGKSWLNSEEGVVINSPITKSQPNYNTTDLAKSGYIKISVPESKITPDMGKIEIQKTSPGVAFGGLFWQYFEDMDKVTKADGGILMKKELFKKENTASGQKLMPITENTPLKVGDLVTVRLVIKTDREMEFIHIKDMRASGFEPVNVISSYKYQNGNGYYESTRDAATNFFFDFMRIGTYVFEYDVRCNNAGSFSNGITQLQNMYAPEMSSHSEGIRVEIK